MWCCVDFVWTDVPEESIAFIFRVEKSASEESTWALCRLQTPANAGSSETLVQTKSTRHIPEDGILHSDSCEILKSYTVLVLLSNQATNSWNRALFEVPSGFLAIRLLHSVKCCLFHDAVSNLVQIICSRMVGRLVRVSFFIIQTIIGHNVFNKFSLEPVETSAQPRVLFQ
jgi:hypothetical protein